MDIYGPEGVTGNKFHNEYSQILDTTLKKSVAPGICAPMT